MNIAVMKTISLPVQPWRGFRDTDAYGSGVFGASRDGGSRKHLGRDLIAQVGDLVVAPFPCKVKRLGVAYAGSFLQLVELEGVGGFSGWRSRLLYVLPNVDAGAVLEEGEPIGTAQNVAGYYKEQEPRAGAMTNHVHWEVSLPVDPGALVGSIPLQVTT